MCLKNDIAHGYTAKGADIDLQVLGGPKSTSQATHQNRMFALSHGEHLCGALAPPSGEKSIKALSTSTRMHICLTISPGLAMLIP